MPGNDTRRVQFDFIGRDQVTPVMNRVGKSAEGLHSKMGNLAGAIGGKLATAAKGGALALGAMAGSAVVFGVKTAASMEQSKVAFTTMLGSASKAQKMLGDLQKFAASTPFEFSDVTRASQRLMAMGFTAKQVIPTLTGIGDAVAGLGGGAGLIDQITLAIGQMQAKGKIQGGEMLQLTGAGIPALKILANGYHVTTGQMDKMISSGKVMSTKAIPMLISGIEKGTKSTQKFGGMMEAQSHTLTGLWSNLSDNVSQALGNMMTPFMGPMKAGLGGMVTLTGKVGTAFQTKLVPAIKMFGAEAKKGFKLGDMDKAKGFAQKLGVAFKLVADWTKTQLVPALILLGHWIKDILIPALQKFANRWLKDATTAFKDVRKAVVDNHKPLQSLGTFLGKAGTVLTKYVIPVFGTFSGSTLIVLGKGISLTIKYVANWWKTMQFLGKVVFSVGNTIVQSFLFMAGSVIHSAARAFGWMPGIGPKLKTASKEFDSFAGRVNSAINGIKKGKDVKITVSAAGHWQIPGGGKAATTAGLARGGPVPAIGPAPSRARDSVPAMLRVDEHVLTPEEVDGAGGHGAIYRMRRLMKAGKLRGFSAGGAVGVSASMATPSAASMQSSVWQPINSGVAAMIAKIATALSKMNVGATGVVAAARRMKGLPYSWGGGGANGPSYGIGRGAGTFGFDCSGLSEFAWWQGAHKEIGGVTNSQWANSRPISGPRPGALAFPSGPGVHVMIGSDRPGYVIQAPHTGAFVEEVPRTSGNWRWPTAAGYAKGGAVYHSKIGRPGVGATHGSKIGRPGVGATHGGTKPLHYGWTPATEATDAWHQVGTNAWVRQREQASDGPWGGIGARIRAKVKAKALKADVEVTKGHGGPPGAWMAAVEVTKGHGRLGERFIRGMLSTAEVNMALAANIAGGSQIRARARGGPVLPGMSYLVGERGPEIMSPRTAGTIHPNGSALGTTVNLNVIVQGHALATKREIADEVLSALRVAKKQGVNVKVVG